MAGSPSRQSSRSGGACLAGSPLYLSSVGSAAVQNELRHSCLADVGLRIPLGGAQPDSIARLQKLADPLAAHTQPSVVSRIAPGISVTTTDLTERSSAPISSIATAKNRTCCDR